MLSLSKKLTRKRPEKRLPLQDTLKLIEEYSKNGSEKLEIFRNFDERFISSVRN